VPNSVAESLQIGNFREASALLLSYARSETQSEFGFVGVVLNGELLRLLAHEGFHWHETINRGFYEKMITSFQQNGYLDFLETHNLVGRVILHHELVLTNSPASHPHSGGVPPGHPALHCFLGVPAIKDNAVVGMIGLANRNGGYTEVERLKVEPLAPTLTSLYDCYNRALHSVA